jgi:hypothetical protein
MVQRRQCPLSLSAVIAQRVELTLDSHLRRGYRVGVDGVPPWGNLAPMRRESGDVTPAGSRSASARLRRRDIFDQSSFLRLAPDREG